MKVVVIGGGAAGMLAAIASQKEGNDTIIIEKNEKLGKKMLITGKGRCNITNGIDISEFINNVPRNGKFLFSAFQNFNNKDIIDLLDIEVKEERGHRIFPVSDRSQDVVNSLINKLKNVTILSNTVVDNLIVEENKVIGVEIFDKNKQEKSSIKCDKVIIATGGKSYPLTGSTGDGYRLAKSVGHTITEIRPSLVPLVAGNNSLDTCQKLQGLSLKNVAIKVFNNNKLIYKDFGEMLFTHFGVSGPIILSASSILVNENELVDCKIEIDLKPALTDEMLDKRILRDFETEKNKDFRNSLDELLPKTMIPVIVDQLQFNKKVNEITKEERAQLVYLLKHFTIEIADFRGIDEAIITRGGVSTKEINPKNMESKLCKNLFFAGEVIDVDAYTGGFNLQIAYSTGYTAGLNIE